MPAGAPAMGFGWLQPPPLPMISPVPPRTLVPALPPMRRSILPMPKLSTSARSFKSLTGLAERLVAAHIRDAIDAQVHLGELRHSGPQRLARRIAPGQAHAAARQAIALLVVRVVLEHQNLCGSADRPDGIGLHLRQRCLGFCVLLAKQVQRREREDGQPQHGTDQEPATRAAALLESGRHRTLRKKSAPASTAYPPAPRSLTAFARTVTAEDLVSSMAPAAMLTSTANTSVPASPGTTNTEASAGFDKAALGPDSWLHLKLGLPVATAEETV